MSETPLAKGNEGAHGACAAGSDSSFQTTQWTGVLAARGSSPEARTALSQLCSRYYEPVFVFLRREGRPEDAARELAHEFFAGLLAGDPFSKVEPGCGKFRSYLLGALKHFLSHRRERERRVVRGGQAVHRSMDEQTETFCGGEIADAQADAPDRAYDQAWATLLLDGAVAVLRAEYADRGEAEVFARIQPWLSGEAAHGDQRALALELGIPASVLKTHVHRMKLRFRTLVREAIAETLADPAGTDEEMRSLFAALSEKPRS